MDGTRAQLVLALLILALIPALLTSMPRPTHGVTFDFGPLPEQLEPGRPVDEAGWIRPHIRSTAYLRRRFDIPKSIPAPRDPDATRHILELLPSGQRLLDSRPVGVDEFRARIDWLHTTEGWVDFRPDPGSRFEDVVEILAAVARSDFDRLRLDNSRFASAVEGD